MTDTQPPLSWESSTGSRPQVSTCLPAEVVSCLQNARFLHLATCTHNIPHVSLMNYTYLDPSTPSIPSTLPSGPIVIMTTNPSSKKTLNLLENPNVSLLAHDWVSHRPSNARSTSPEGRRNPGRSSLASLLMGMNASEMGSISTTINGVASVLPQGSEEEKWCKARHLENNTFDEPSQAPSQLLSTSPSSRAQGDGGLGSFIEDEEVRVVVVKINDGRIADWKGSVKDWVLASNQPGQQLANGPVHNSAQ